MLSFAGVYIGGTASRITSVAFYAMGDTKPPTVLPVTAYTIYIPLKVLAFLRYGLIALVVTMSIYFVVSFPVQSLVLEKAVRLHLCNGREAFAGKKGQAERRA